MLVLSLCFLATIVNTFCFPLSLIGLCTYQICCYSVILLKNVAGWLLKLCSNCMDMILSMYTPLLPLVSLQSFNYLNLGNLLFAIVHCHSHIFRRFSYVCLVTSRFKDKAHVICLLNLLVQHCPVQIFIWIINLLSGAIDS